MRPASSAALTLWSLTQVRYLSTPPPAAPRAALSIAGSLSSRGARMVLPDMTILPGWGVARLPERPGQDRSSHRLGTWKKSILLPPRMSRACRKLFLDRPASGLSRRSLARPNTSQYLHESRAGGHRSDIADRPG